MRELGHEVKFLEFCFPQIYVLIDWSQAPRILDKEFQQITPLSELGRRAVDKLVEVRLLSGEVEWILIHLEIQNQWIGDGLKFLSWGNGRLHGLESIPVPRSTAFLIANLRFSH